MKASLLMLYLVKFFEQAHGAAVPPATRCPTYRIKRYPQALAGIFQRLYGHLNYAFKWAAPNRPGNTIAAADIRAQ
jgi:hypothetical protein